MGTKGCGAQAVTIPSRLRTEISLPEEKTTTTGLSRFSDPWSQMFFAEQLLILKAVNGSLALDRCERMVREWPGGSITYVGYSEI